MTLTKLVLGLILIAGFAFTLQSCKECDDPRNPDCDNYNPCLDAAATSANFTIKEATIQHITSPNLTDFLMDTDSCYMNSVFFEATQQDADSFIWKIGNEVEPRYGKQVNVTFPNNLRGTTFNVRLIVKRKPNTQCFPNDDGIDTVTRKFYFVRFNEKLSWEGTYYGSDADKPDSLYTIVLGHSYNEVQNRDLLKIFGMPRGCQDTVNQQIIASIITYKNVTFNRQGAGCEQKIVGGIQKSGSDYTIKQLQVTVENGIIINKEKLFTGIKIN